MTTTIANNDVSSVLTNDNTSSTSSFSSLNLKTKKGISYILGDSCSNENHILPINSITYSNLTNQLFTGGRDGNVKIWQPNYVPDKDVDAENIVNTYDSFPDCPDLDEKILRLETSITSNPLNYNYKNISKDNSFEIIENFNLHFDWINDLQLINNNKNLVTCSNDLSIKILDLFSLTNVKTANIHKLPNVHTDYIKKISPFTHQQHSIISGGLDGRIVIWDLNQLKPLQLINNLQSTSTSNITSIYSLANNDSNIISTGGPSNTINIFDKRLNNPFLRNLIGHQDNIRCLLMNDSFILSGSSDTTIKLWDLRTFKVYKNFDIHDSSVWSLTSDDFKVFYSGDKDGNIIKTDLSKIFNKTSSTQTNHTNDDFFATSSDEKLGVSTFVAKSSSPILSICHEPIQDTLFATNYESLNRYVNPDTSQLSQYQYLRQYLDNNNNDKIFPDENDVQSNPQTDDLNSDFYDLISHLSIETNPNNVNDLQSTFSHNIINNGETPPTFDEDDEALDDLNKEEYISMFLNTNGGPSNEFINAFKSEEEEEAVNEYIDLTPIEILLNPIPSDQITLVPFNITPIEKYNLVPKSIVAKKMLNNRRKMLVLYLNGDIKIWDLITCKVTETYPYSSDNSVLLPAKDLENRIRELDNLFHKLQTKDTLNNWCEVEIKSEKLLVTIKESSYLNVEIYYDELVSSYPFLDINHSDNSPRYPKSRPTVTNDDRFYLGVIMLNSLFRGYALYEENFDLQLREELKNKSTKLNDKRRLKFLGRKSSYRKDTSSTQSSPATSTNVSVMDMSITEEDNDTSITTSPEVLEFIATSEDQYIQSTPDYGDTIMKLLQMNKKIYVDKYLSSTKLVDTILRTHEITSSTTTGTKDPDLRYYPIIPYKYFPKDLVVRIFEYSSELGNYRDLCSFQLNDIVAQPSPSLVQDLRFIIPKWMAFTLLFNKHPIKESPKLTFSLTEIPYDSLSPDMKKRITKKKFKLPTVEGGLKLTSHGMIRVVKIISYVLDKMDKKVKDEMVLECNGIELSNEMTLQYIKTMIWKSSGDIVLNYRRKF
ncbi:hypothetical protein G210_5793 [Candida maltosa Xu316]|uniref:WD40 repeat-like protein n=1 Tax=Candida maltosa (strain Xu316) TaxID=1245528 RepID=M3K3V3_CANMX|nr:hypothetical protein G210_5793 [Candida maltosa Xu316]